MDSFLCGVAIADADGPEVLYGVFSLDMMLDLGFCDLISGKEHVCVVFNINQHSRPVSLPPFTKMVKFSTLTMYVGSMYSCLVWLMTI